MTTSRRFTTAKLSINVKPVDSKPPVIHSSALEGFVDENAQVGTKIVDATGQPIRINVTDEDLVRAVYIFLFFYFTVRIFISIKYYVEYYKQCLLFF